MSENLEDFNLFDKIQKTLHDDDEEDIRRALHNTKADEKSAELASQKGVIVVVENYLNYGGDVNKIFTRKENGVEINTCLLYNAIIGDHFDMAKMLLERGACKSLKFEDKYYRTCLQLAFIKENHGLVDLFGK